MDHFTRREFIRLSTVRFAALTALLPAFSSFATRANADEGRLAEGTPLNWDAFLSAVTLYAEKAGEPGWDEEKFVKSTTAALARLKLSDPVLAQAFAKLKRKTGPNPAFAQPHFCKTFQVSLIQFEKGEIIPHHDHPSMCGVIMGATGELAVENFRELAEKSPSGKLLLAKSKASTLKPGEIDTLTATRDNIHLVKATKFTEVVDVFAPPYDADRIRRSRYFDVDTVALAGRRDVFEATARK